MDAALKQLLSKGALAGLNLREVADAVGVTPANIYYFFGGRQGLLRAAITRELELLSEPMDELAGAPFGERRVRMFDEIMRLPALRLSALLALDDDPDYVPLPFFATSREEWQRQIESGDLPASLDIEAVYLITVMASSGMSLYASALARQLDVDEDELLARTRTVLDHMVSRLVADPPPLPEP